jgi:hypothetical protein
VLIAQLPSAQDIDHFTTTIILAPAHVSSYSKNENLIWADNSQACIMGPRRMHNGNQVSSLDTGNG